MTIVAVHKACSDKGRRVYNAQTTKDHWLLVFIVLAVISQLIGFASPAHSGFGYRKAITINKTQVSGTLSNFPVLISLTANELRTTGNGGHVQNSNGYDIVFRAADGTTPLAHEVESYSSTTGQFVAWVNVPTISTSADTKIYVYYGDNSITTPTQNSAAVWDSQFKGVWHLSPSLIDSTNNGNNGTNNGTGDDSGKIVRGRSFNGSYVSTSSDQLKNTGAFTISLWFKADLTSFAHHLIWQGEHGGNGFGDQQEMHLTIGNKSKGVESGNLLAFFLGYRESTGTALNVATPFSDTGSWHQAAVVVNNMSSSPSATLYLDGLAKGSGSSTTSETARDKWDTGFRLGRPSASDRDYKGKMDEVRISTTNRSSDWILTEYRNQNDPNSFVAVGAEENIAAPTTFLITALAGTNGSITPAGVSTVAQGASQAYVVAANSSYRVYDVKVDGVSVSLTNGQYIFSNVQTNHQIEVVFAANATGTPPPSSGPTVPGCGQNISMNYSTSGFTAADFNLTSVSVQPTRLSLYLDTGYYAIDPNRIIIPFTQEVAVTFFYEGAGYTKNDLGWMLASEGLTGTKHEIYSNINDNNNNGILDDREGWPQVASQGVFVNRVNLGTFAAGTEIVFYLHIDSDDPNDNKYVYTKKDWNPDTYQGGCTATEFDKIYNLGLPNTTEGTCHETSNWMPTSALTRLNTIFGLDFTGAQSTLHIVRNQKFSHALAGVPLNKPNEWILGWEDLLNGGDTDHNDMIFHIERRTGGRAQLKNPITPTNAEDYYTGVTFVAFDYLPCGGNTKIVYYVSIDNGANWLEITDWDEIWRTDASKNPIEKLASWTPGNPEYTKRSVRIDFAGRGITGRELTWKADFTSNRQGCEPEVIDVQLNADVAGHGFFSRSSPVVKANVIYSGFYETPAIGWRDKSLRGHLQATRLYDPSNPDVTAEQTLWDAGEVLTNTGPAGRTIYFPQISVGQVTSQEIAAGNGTDKMFSGTLSPVPIAATSLIITDGREVFRDRHTDVLEGSLGGTGTINRFSGAFSLTFHEAPAANGSIQVSYSYYAASSSLQRFEAGNVTRATLGLDDTYIIPKGYVYDFDKDNDVDDNDAHLLMNWVRGYEPGTSVKREWLLEPIDHSVPAVVTSPGLPMWYFGTATTKSERQNYDQFRSANVNRPTVIYVGSRGGMLHAFNAGSFSHGDNLDTPSVTENRGYFKWGDKSSGGCQSYCSVCSSCPDYGTGGELWAFIPANLLPRLKNNLLAKLNKERVSDYDQAYVDASPGVADVYINGAWRTVLLSAEGNGGDTVFCLDVTNPNSPRFMWEFSDPDLFRSRSSPSVGKIGRIVYNGSAKWVAFFVSGNDDRYDRTQYPSVYMIDIESGAVLQRIFLNAEPAGIGGVPSGQPTIIDSDGNGYIDRFYIGTDKGFLYKVNIPDDPDATKYSISQCVVNTDFIDEGGSSVSNEWRYQPIYGSPVAVVDNSVSENGAISYQVRIFYGTGDSPYYAEDINISGTRYHFLAYVDRAPKGNCSPSYVSLDWFYELPEGQRVFSSAFAAAGLIYFGTSTANTEDPCENGGLASNNQGEIFAFNMGRPSDPLAPIAPTWHQTVGNVAAAPLVEDQHLYLKTPGSGLQSFGHGKYNNEMIFGGWPELRVLVWHELW
jgi:type IV pilus assembly protein PilY1